MNRNDVIDVLTAVAGARQRTVGQVDVDVWQAVIGDLPRYDREGNDMPINAVRDHLREAPGTWIEPGHIYGRVKAMVRDQLDRESNEDREARQAAIDARIELHVNEIAATKGIPEPEPKYRRRPKGPSPLDVRCTWCHANIGNRCVVPGTNEQPSSGFHPSRVDAARGVA